MGESMRNTLMAMAEGKFSYDHDELMISEKRLELVCDKDETIRGKFVMESRLGAEIKGVLYSSNYRMKCLEARFCGRRIEVEYEFNSRGLAPKETIKGDLYVESNVGEYNLPFVVTVVSAPVDSPVGPIRNLFHFANLAMVDYEQAYRLFVSKRFREVEMTGTDRVCYDMLMESKPCREHMEEFLIAAHKKKPVEISLQDASFDGTHQGTDFSKTISIHKKGWGYVRIDVTARGEFLKLSKTRLGNDDFIGDDLEYSFVVDGSRLHAGKNYGEIIFSHGLAQERFEIVVNKPQRNREEHGAEIRRLKMELCRLYVKVRTHAIHNATWIKESMLRLDELMGLVEPSRVLTLFRAHLLILDKRKEEGEFQLEKIRKERALKKHDPEAFGYYVYIEALNRRQEDFTARVLEELRELHEAYPESELILWSLLFMDDELQGNPGKKYKLMKECFDFGCRSPILYVEAFLLIKADDALLTMLGSFEKQVMNFAVKNGLMTEKLSEQLGKLALSVRIYDGMLTRVLKKCSETMDSVSVTEGICSQLIKGGFRDGESFPWYEKGVRAGLKLNLLYEYYLYTIPLDYREALPKPLLLYFSYNQGMDYRHKAFLYSNVTRHEAEFPEIFERYEPYVESFVEEQLSKRRMTEDLAYLYQVHWENLVKKEALRDVFESMLFTHVIACASDRMLKVVVGCEELGVRESFHFSDRKAMARIYTDASLIALEDTAGFLHFNTVDFELKPLFSRSRITRYAQSLQKTTTGLLLNRYKKSGIILERESISLCNGLLRKKEITPAFREEITVRLIDVFEERNEEEMVLHLLDGLELRYMDPKRRGAFLDKMISYGMYEEAYALLFEYGLEYVGRKRLVRLCSIKISEGVVSDRLTTLCRHVFLGGKYDEAMLNYLIANHRGSTGEMLRLWRAAQNFSLDAHEVEGRLLTQMLYTGFMPRNAWEVFQSYVKGGARREIVLAYVSYVSYHYVVNEELVEEAFFGYVLHRHLQGEQLRDSELIAYVKFCSRQDSLGEEQRKLAVYGMKALESKGIRFGFFGKVEKLAGVSSDGREKTVIEYLTNPKDRVFLYYRILDDGAGNAPFEKEELHPMLGPFFSREMTIFCGETLQYYVARKKAGEQERIVGSGLVRKEPDELENVDGRYGWINEMYVSRSLKDEVTLLEWMNKYNRYQKITDKLFTLKE